MRSSVTKNGILNCVLKKCGPARWFSVAPAGLGAWNHHDSGQDPLWYHLVPHHVSEPKGQAQRMCVAVYMCVCSKLPRLLLAVYFTPLVDLLQESFCG